MGNTMCSGGVPTKMLSEEATGEYDVRVAVASGADAAVEAVAVVLEDIAEGIAEAAATVAGSAPVVETEAHEVETVAQQVEGNAESATKAFTSKMDAAMAAVTDVLASWGKTGAVDTAVTVEEKADGTVEAVGEAIEKIAEKVADAAAAVVGTVPAVEAEAVEVETVAEEFAGTVKQAAENLTSSIDALMDAADAAVTSSMIIEFAADKGAEQQVGFKTQLLGFELGLAGGGCCGPKGPAGVVVKKVEKRGQAESLGVRRSWRLKSINGVEVTGLEQARKLLAEHVLRLPAQ